MHHIYFIIKIMYFILIIQLITNKNIYLYCNKKCNYYYILKSYIIIINNNN